jgi:hypothetical protein
MGSFFFAKEFTDQIEKMSRNENQSKIFENRKIKLAQLWPIRITKKH